jgi:hypothetical protein
LFKERTEFGFGKSLCEFHSRMVKKELQKLADAPVTTLLNEIALSPMRPFERAWRLEK